MRVEPAAVLFGFIANNPKTEIAHWTCRFGFDGWAALFGRFMFCRHLAFCKAVFRGINSNRFSGIVLHKLGFLSWDEKGCFHEWNSTSGLLRCCMRGKDSYLKFKSIEEDAAHKWLGVLTAHGWSNHSLDLRYHKHRRFIMQTVGRCKIGKCLSHIVFVCSCWFQIPICTTPKSPVLENN